MLFKSYWKAVFILLRCSLTFAICSFPDYTRLHNRWEAKISQERHAIGEYWTFNQTAVEYTVLTKQQASDTFNCEQEFNPDTFLIRLNLKVIKNAQSPNEENSNEMMIYRCIQILKHSNNVLQLNISPLSLFGPKELMCGESRLVWESRILIWSKLTDFEPCPVVGGFQFFMTDRLLESKYCANLYLPPVFESECMQKEGMVIDFRNFNCRGNLGMQLNQKLFCMGTWTEGNYTFSVTSNADETWPRLWLFRFPVLTQKDRFNVDILKDIQVITTESIDTSVDHYTVHLSRKSYVSTCQDEAVVCNNCTNINTLMYCQKSCNSCHSTELGQLSNNLTGDWILFSHNGIKNVTVAMSYMMIGDITYSYLDLKMTKWYKTKDRIAMTIAFSNGCKPRYLCADFIRKSSSVLLYRLSQYVSWPQTPSLSTDEICNENLFSEVKSQLSGIPGNHKYRVLVSNNATWQQKTSCGLEQGRLHLNAHFPRSNNCRVIINSCANNSAVSFKLVLSDNCSNKFHITNEQECLASFKDEINDDQVIITQDVNTQIAYCWILHKEEWEPRPRLFVTYAADCNSDVAKYILYKNYTGYLAYFDIAPGPGVLGSYNCEEDFGWLTETSVNGDGEVTEIKKTSTSYFNLNTAKTTSTKTQQMPNEKRSEIQAPIITKNNGIRKQGTVQLLYISLLLVLFW